MLNRPKLPKFFRYSADRQTKKNHTSKDWRLQNLKLDFEADMIQIWEERKSENNIGSCLESITHSWSWRVDRDLYWGYFTADQYICFLITFSSNSKLSFSKQINTDISVISWSPVKASLLIYLKCRVWQLSVGLSRLFKRQNVDFSLSVWR